MFEIVLEKVWSEHVIIFPSSSIYNSGVTWEKVMVMLYGPTRRYRRRWRREKNPWKITQNLNNLKFKFWMVNVSRHHHRRVRGNWIQHHISLLCMTSSKSEAIYHITIIHIIFISIYFSNVRHGMMVIFNSRILNKIISIFVWILIKQAFIYTYTYIYYIVWKKYDPFQCNHRWQSWKAMLKKRITKGKKTLHRGTPSG